MEKLLPTKKSQIGFTLIELLIVIAIIVIIVALAAVSYTTVNRNARDSKRQSDLAKIASDLERYYSDHGTYPNTNLNGQFETAGRDCGYDKICCLLGGTIAPAVKNVNPTPPPPTLPACKVPYNVYIDPGNLLGTFGPLVYSYSGLPQDPFIDRNSYSQVTAGNSYAYASDGQSYVLSTMRYEGNPPAANAFTSTFDTYYRNQAHAWNGTLNWDSQYAIKSPSR